MGMIEAHQLVEKIAVGALRLAPPEASEVTAVFDTVGVTDAMGIHLGPPSRENLLSFPPNDDEDEMLDAFTALRSELYTPEGGAFYRACVTVNRDGVFSADYDYDVEPDFDFPVDPKSYAADLMAFPRDPATCPAWLIDKLRQASES